MEQIEKARAARGGHRREGRDPRRECAGRPHRRRRRPGGPAAGRGVARRRTVALVQPGTSLPAAPYAAVEPTSAPRRDAMVGSWPDSAHAAPGGRQRPARPPRRGPDPPGADRARHGTTSRHESRRHARAADADGPGRRPDRAFATALAREAGEWRARAVLDLAEVAPREPGAAPDVPTRPGWPASPPSRRRTGPAASASSACATCGWSPTPTGRRTGGDGALLLTATSAGPGGFRTGHTSVWALDPDTLDLGAPRRPVLPSRDGGVLRRPRDPPRARRRAVAGGDEHLG